MNEWDSWVGRETVTEAVLDPAQANRLAVTLDREPSFRAGDDLPPAWHWLYFHDLVRSSQLGADGHPALGVTMPPVPLERRMWAGGTLSFREALRLGELARRTSRITSIEEKHGKTGTLYFVTVDSEVAVADRVGVAERQMIVYREATATSAGLRPVAPEASQFSRRWELDSTALFRYSALTFNSHRIHYDTDYSRDVEGYENLVIHGPLIATLLLDLAVAEGHTVRTFDYRAKSPLLLPDPFTVNGSVADGTGQLWAATLDGRLAMEAQVELG